MASNWFNLPLNWYRVLYPEAFIDSKDDNSKQELLEHKQAASLVMFDLLSKEAQDCISLIVNLINDHKNISNFRFITATFDKNNEKIEMFKIPILAVLSNKDRIKALRKMVTMVFLSLGYLMFDYDKGNKKYVSAFQFEQGRVASVGANKKEELKQYYDDNREWYTYDVKW